MPATAEAIFDATVRFQKPARSIEWRGAGIVAAFERVWSLIETTLVRR